MNDHSTEKLNQESMPQKEDSAQQESLTEEKFQFAGEGDAQEDNPPDTYAQTAAVREFVGDASPEMGGDKLGNLKDLDIDVNALKADFASSKQHASETDELLQEVAEDMVDVLAKLNAISERQAMLEQKFDYAFGITQTMGKNHALELSGIRKELLSEEKSAAHRSIFSTVVGTLDQMRAMAGGLDAEEDERTLKQMTAVIYALTSIIQSLGIEEFSIAAGEMYDPNTMECIGYAEGEPGLVMKTLRPGYRAGSMLFRSAGVELGVVSECYDENNDEDNETNDEGGK